MNDEAILELFGRRDETAIQSVADKYGRYCASIALRILESRESCEECVNDAWLSAWNAIPPQRPSVLRTYLGAVTRNLALNRVRDLAREKRGGGHIDEWSPQEEYQRELASNIAGDVYTVRGYSPDFRLVVKGSDPDENGTEVPYCMFFENLNGIGLTFGSDLFGDRLGLRERWESITAETHESWYNSLGEYTTLENTEAFGAFLEGLYAGRFEYTHETRPEIYDTEHQSHITFTLTDGTAVELRLIEGGYVGYDPLPWYFVKMPGDAFDAIFEAAR